MKKLLAILLALVMALSLAACSEGDAEVEIKEEKGKTEEKAEEEKGKTEEIPEESGRTVEEALAVWEDIWNGDMSGYDEMVPDALWAQYKSVYAEEYDQWLANSQESLKSSVDESQELKGKINMKILNREELPEEDVALIAEAVTNMYELKGDQVKAACKLNVEVTYENAESESGEMCAMQYGDDWYLIIYTVYEKGECNVNFYI